VLGGAEAQAKRRPSDKMSARSRVDLLLQENKQLKKRLELAEQDNRELKASVYDLSLRLNSANSALARTGKGGRLYDMDGPSSTHTAPQSQPHDDSLNLQQTEREHPATHSSLMKEAAAREETSTHPDADGRHFAFKYDLKGHTGAVYATRFSPNGRLLASASFDRTVRCWSTEEREAGEALCLQEHKHSTSCLSWAADSALLLSGSYDHTVRLWDVATGTSSGVWTVPDAAFVQSVDFHPTSNHVFVASSTGKQLLLFDTREPARAPAAFLNDCMVNSAHFLPSCEQLLAGDKHGALNTWDLRARALTSTFYLLEARKPISHICLSPPIARALAARAGAAGSASVGSGGSGNTSFSGDEAPQEARLLGVNSYDDVLRVYTEQEATRRGRLPSHELAAEDGAEAEGEGGSGSGAELAAQSKRSGGFGDRYLESTQMLTSRGTRTALG
jgi:COMPASS component SWD3